MKKKRRKGKVLPKPPLPKKTSFIHRLKFLMKKAQTAMEYVLTYGWAVLIILFALSSLFYIGVFEPKTPNQCIINAPFICNDVKAYDDTIIYTINSKGLTNAEVADLKINGQSCKDISIGTGGILLNPQSNPDRFNINSQNEIVCMSVPEMYKKASSELILNYQTQQGIEHTITGSSSVNIEEGTYLISPVISNLENLKMTFGFDFEDGLEITTKQYYGTILSNGAIDFVTEPVLGNVAYFDDSDYIILENQPILNTNYMAAEFLIKFDQIPSIEYPIFVKEIHGDPLTNFNYGFYINNNRELVFRLNTGASGGCIKTIRSDPLDLGEWNYVTGTFNGMIGPPKMEIYINGAKIGEEPTCSSVIFQRDVPIYIGTDSDMSDSFVGYLDSVVLYKNYLSGDEVREHYEHYTPPS